MEIIKALIPPPPFTDSQDWYIWSHSEIMGYFIQILAQSVALKKTACNWMFRPKVQSANVNLSGIYLIAGHISSVLNERLDASSCLTRGSNKAVVSPPAKNCRLSLQGNLVFLVRTMEYLYLIHRNKTISLEIFYCYEKSYCALFIQLVFFLSAGLWYDICHFHQAEVCFFLGLLWVAQMKGRVDNVWASRGIQTEPDFS